MSSHHHHPGSGCHHGPAASGYTHHSSAGSWASHGSAADFLRRFWIVTVLLVPLIVLMSPVLKFLNLPDFSARPYLSLALATAIFYFALVFFEHARHEIKSGQYGMMTLVSVAVGSGYAFSAASTFIPALAVEFYVEISTLIWVLLFGHYLEARSSAAAGNALAAVKKLLPRTTHRLRNDQIEDIDISVLQVGDLVLIKPGEKIPADGVIKTGRSALDESFLSGESKPVEKTVGDQVVAGAIALDGSLTVSLTAVWENSTVKQIERLIAAAQKTKPTTQRLADRAAGWLTLIAVLSALATLLIWTFAAGASLVFALTLAITVLVIACPHALGLAIPTVTTIGTTLAVKNGIFIKNLAKIETLRRADYVVFDKTGTLTTGQFGVINIVTSSDQNKLLILAASLSALSSHVISQSIVRRAAEADLKLAPVSDFKNLAGRGLTGVISGQRYYLGNLALMTEQNIDLSNSLRQTFADSSAAGETVVLLGAAMSRQVLGLIVLSDQIRPESQKAIADLHRLGLKAAMLTGDHAAVAAAVAQELNIDIFFAEVLPEDKYKHVRELQTAGHRVIMVGDGVNDAPALTQADIGVAIGAGTDVAVEAGDVVLTRSNPADIVRLIVLSRKLYRKMVENLIWALGYNVVALPAAAGAFAAWGFFLRPEIGALLMSLSSVIVVLNALALKNQSLSLS